MTAGTSWQHGLRVDTGLVLAGQLAAVASAALLAVVGARVLPVEEFGALSWALAWLGTLAVLAQAGLAQVATTSLAADGERSPRAVVLGLLAGALAASAVVALAWWAALGPLAVDGATPPDAYAGLVAVVAAWLPVAAVGPVVANALRARRRFGLAVLVGEHVRRMLLVAVLLLAAGAVPASLPVAAAWVVALETACYAVGAVVLLRVVGSSSGPGGSALASALASLRTGRGFVLAGLASASVPQAGVWLLAASAPAAEVAVLAVAVRLAVLLGTPTLVGMRTLAPRIAGAHAAGALPALQGPVLRSAAWSTGATVVAALALAAGGPGLLAAVFGAEYGAAYVPSLLLAAGAVVNAWTGPCSVVLSHTGSRGVVALASVLAALAFFGLGAWWATAGGATGVAAAAAVAMSARNLVLARAARRRTGLRTIAVPSRRG